MQWCFEGILKDELNEILWDMNRDFTKLLILGGLVVISWSFWRYLKGLVEGHNSNLWWLIGVEWDRISSPKY